MESIIVMNVDRLIEELDAVLPALPPEDAAPYTLGWLLKYATMDPSKSDARLIRFITVLSEEPDLGSFNGYMQVGVSGASRVEYATLAGWLLRRSNSVGSEQAVLDMQRYLEATAITYSYITAIAGIKPQDRYQITTEVDLVPWDSIRDGFQKRSISKMIDSRWVFQRPTAALVCRVSRPKIHVTPHSQFKIVEATFC